jgi:hypothetical protein
MLVVVYAVLGIFLLRAARDPLRNLSLIWFTVWSSMAHGGLMTVQAMSDASEHAHLAADVPALFLGAAVLAALTPRSAETSEALPVAANERPPHPFPGPPLPPGRRARA